MRSMATLKKQLVRLELKASKMIRTVLGIVIFSTLSIDPTYAGFIVNGGFEQPGISSGTTSGFNPSNSHLLPGWTVVSGDIDLVKNTFYPAAEGLYSVDLVGLNLGVLEQAFTTVVGVQYDLKFQYSNNGRTPTGIDYRAQVSVQGNSSLLNQVVTHRDATVANMDYRQFSGSFIADSTETTLRFSALNGASQNGGVNIDDVVVNESVPEPSTFALIGFGCLCLVGYRRRQIVAALFRKPSRIRAE